MITLKNSAAALLLCSALLVPRSASSQVGGMSLSGTAGTAYTNILRINLDGSGTTNLLVLTNATGVFGNTNGTFIRYISASNRWFWQTSWTAFVATNVFNAPTGTFKLISDGTTYGQVRYQPRSVGAITTAAPAASTTVNISADTSGNVSTTNVFASSAEVDTGTNTTKVLSPASLANASIGALTTGTIFVDAISGSDTTGIGNARKPYATLTKAQSVATNGQTIYGVRGTFVESNLGANGVNWYFNKGVVVLGAPIFLMGATNGVTNLVIGGDATFTNTLVAFGFATNCYVNIRGDSHEMAASSVGSVYDVTLGLNSSNRVYLDFRTIPRGVLYQPISGTATNDNFWWITARGRESLMVNTTPAASSGSSNKLFSLFAPFVYPGGNGFAATMNTVFVKADWFSRIRPDGTSATITSLQSNYVWNVNVLTTNDLNTNLAGIWRGQVNVLR